MHKKCILERSSNERRIKWFIKLAYTYGRVRELEEAFEEFPVEEEWHKGKVENVLKENKDSIIKTDTLYKLSDKQILFRVGEIEKEKIEEYKKSFYNELKKQ